MLYNNKSVKHYLSTIFVIIGFQSFSTTSTSELRPPQPTDPLNILNSPMLIPVQQGDSINSSYVSCCQPVTFFPFFPSSLVTPEKPGTGSVTRPATSTSQIFSGSLSSTSGPGGYWFLSNRTSGSEGFCLTVTLQSLHSLLPFPSVVGRGCGTIILAVQDEEEASALLIIFLASSLHLSDEYLIISTWSTLHKYNINKIIKYVL